MVPILPRSVYRTSESSAWSDAGLNVMTPPEIRELARRLLACEAIPGKSSEPEEFATLRVYEKLRQSLVVFAGVDGFQALAFRALTQAKSEAPGLWAAQVAVDGTLQGLGESRPQPMEFEPQLSSEKDRASEEGVILIARMLGLLTIFLGEALTFGQLRNAWPGVTFDDRSSENGRES